MTRDHTVERASTHPAPIAPPASDRRLRRSQDFRMAMRRGRRSRDVLVHVATRRSGLPHNRHGFSVSRRVGGAVTRNRVKRRLRQIMRTLPIRGGHDVIVIAQEPAAIASYKELRRAVERCLAKLDLLCPEEP